MGYVPIMGERFPKSLQRLTAWERALVTTVQVPSSTINGLFLIMCNMTLTNNPKVATFPQRSLGPSKRLQRVYMIL